MTVVTIKHGKILGTEHQGYVEFLGIPYARHPSVICDLSLPRSRRRGTVCETREFSGPHHSSHQLNMTPATVQKIAYI
jgi:hypothetical protein